MTRTTLILIAFVMATGCGDSANPLAPSPPPEVVPPPKPPATEPVSYTSRPRIALEILRLTNEARARGGVCGEDRVPPVRRVTWDGRLRAAAKRHASDMAEHDEIGHDGTDGSTPQSRARDAGYPGVVGENAQFGTSPASFYRDAQGHVDGWLSSPGHCRNLFNPRWRHMGAARVDVEGGPASRLWWMHAVQLFGAR